MALATVGPDSLPLDAIPLAIPAVDEADSLEARLVEDLALDDENLWLLARRCATQVRKKVNAGHPIHSMNYCTEIIKNWVVRR